MTSNASGSPAPIRPPVERHPRPALLAAAVVVGVLLVQSLLSFASGPSVAGSVYGLLGVLAFGAGVFLLLWLVPPSQTDRMPIVLAKGLLATAGGVVASLIVGALGALLLLPVRGFLAFLGDLPGALGSVLERGPLVMLVVLVQWLLVRDRRA